MPMKAIAAAMFLFTTTPALASASYQELPTRPAPKPDAHIAYGTAPQQSTGGHLAAWAAARERIKVASPLHEASPLPMRGVVSLGGILDLEAYRAKRPS